MCLFPLTMKVKTNHYGAYQMKVPCGKCLECRKEQQDSWTTRIYQELLGCQGKAIFVTLTYNEDAVPRVIHEGKEYLELNKRDVQNWLKRYRIRQERDFNVKFRHNRNYKKKTLKYFLCGEYGSVTHRPHYHMIIFNFTEKDFLPLKIDWESNYGFTQVKPIEMPANGTSKSFYNVSAYVGKYAVKGLFDNPMAQNQTQVIDGKTYTIKDSSILHRSFRHCSKGLGACYINKETINYHLANDLPKDTPREVWLQTVCERRKLKVCGDNCSLFLKMPRYYANKIYGEGSELSNEITDYIWHHYNDINCEQRSALQTLEQEFAFADYLDMQETTKNKYKAKELYAKQKEFFVTNSRI